MVDKIYKRRLTEEIVKYLEAPQAIVIYGSRQVGKTTLMKFLMEKHLPKNSFYFDLEMPSLLELCNGGPERVLSYLLQKGANPNERIYLLLDEVQYLDDPSKFIKLFCDHHKQVKLIVSGSSALGMKRKFSQSLAGRTLEFELYPLSFEEFLAFKGKQYRLLPENEKAVNEELVPLCEEFIRFGGYPAVVLENDEKKKKTLLSQIINTYVRKDVRDMGKIRDISAFNRLLAMLASQSAQILNADEIANTAGINKLTLLSYLELLEETFIIRRMPPFSKNKRSEVSKNPKVFFMDTGMQHLLWLKEFPQIVHGSSFETFVFLELCKNGFEAHFWRSRSGAEVDFIVSGRQIYAIEAKSSFDSGSRGLVSFAKKYPAKTEKVALLGEKKNGKYAWEMVKELEEERRV